MKRLLLVVALVFSASSLARAVELAPGLSYVRLNAVDVSSASLAQTIAAGSTVLDFRFAAGETAEAVLAGLKPVRTSPRRLLLVLVSPETSPALRNAIASSLPGAITIGRVSPDFQTDIAVSTPADADRKAFDALAGGTAPDKLIRENGDKPRFDESSLIREHLNGSPETRSVAPASESPAGQPVVDSVLQRAAHIHRGLLALKKIRA